MRMRYMPTKWEIEAKEFLSTKTDRYNKGPDGTPPRWSTVRRKARELKRAFELAAEAAL